MKNISILSLLLCFAFTPHRSCAFDESLEVNSHTFTISVAGYCSRLNKGESIEETAIHYNPETMGREIQVSISGNPLRSHYLVAEGIDPQSPMLGLTQSDADFFSSNLSSDPLVQFESIQNEDGSFTINTEGQKSPLMMVRRKITNREGKENIITADKLSNQNETEQNRRRQEENNQGFANSYGESQKPDIGIEEQTPSDKTVKQQSPSSQEVNDAISFLKNENNISKTLDQLKRLEKSRGTMAFLRCCTVSGEDFAIPALWSVNDGNATSKSVFIPNRLVKFNDGEAYFTISIPNDDNGLLSITPPMVLTGTKSNNQDNFIVPETIPSAVENRKIKDDIYEAFEDYFGEEVATKCLGYLMEEEVKQEPLTLGEFQEVFTRFMKLCDDGHHPDLRGQINKLEPNSFSLPTSSDLSRNEANKNLSYYLQTKDKLLHPEKSLIRFCTSSGVTLGHAAILYGVPLITAAIILHQTGVNGISGMGGVFVSSHFFMANHPPLLHIEDVMRPRPLGDAFFGEAVKHQRDYEIDAFKNIIGGIAFCIASNIGRDPLTRYIVFEFGSGWTAIAIAHCLHVKAYPYFMPHLNLAAKGAWDEWREHQNPESVRIQGIKHLKEAQEKNALNPQHIVNTFKSCSENLKKVFLPSFEEENPSLTVEQIQPLVSQNIQERKKAYDILIRDLQDTNSKRVNSYDVTSAKKEK